MTHEIILAGFGGQGVLFAGKVLSYAGLLDGKEVSWLPSYGPEMRGGTANCSVCVSDEPIGSPLILQPNVLLAMNTPSFDKFIDTVKAGGTAVVDSSMVDSTTDREDIKVFYVPATELASENDLNGMANIILLGKIIKETEMFTLDEIKAGLEKSIPPSKAALFDSNIKAIQIGMNS
ncbi:MAG: 2-oxoacid:ferredoxin oxidoreductase subunit gamma [Clostridiales bacterium]|nr:2-oxoacid:ferredoxin oxidoreductase subunit gamma [Clostridiales bacterium]